MSVSVSVSVVLNDCSAEIHINSTLTRAVASGVKGGDNSRGPHHPGGPTKSRNYTI